MVGRVTPKGLPLAAAVVVVAATDEETGALDDARLEEVAAEDETAEEEAALEEAPLGEVTAEDEIRVAALDEAAEDDTALEEAAAVLEEARLEEEEAARLTETETETLAETGAPLRMLAMALVSGRATVTGSSSPARCPMGEPDTVARSGRTMRGIRTILVKFV
ncbi:hypothetical protein B0H16DRAFT_1524039 [Mycena metata]|uniref:Uncharacterized protein n=1 Tax=Mycena metata TaxID=1033252 RepID=A0AAD7JJB4_9AGAR|nr:hypothetical protein B0H16DRAFT_1524039 [Mycena metata]